MLAKLKRVLGGAVLLGAIGCGSENTAPVSGMVSLDGQPVYPARVMFTPMADKGETEAGVAASALTEADGTYVIPAAAIGKNAVGVMMLPADRDSEEAEDEERPPAVGKPDKSSYDVASGENTIDIKLASLPPAGKPGRRAHDDDDD